LEVKAGGLGVVDGRGNLTTVRLVFPPFLVHDTSDPVLRHAHPCERTSATLVPQWSEILIVKGRGFTAV
jgi:hypothetical protein